MFFTFPFYGCIDHFFRHLKASFLGDVQRAHVESPLGLRTSQSRTEAGRPAARGRTAARGRAAHEAETWNAKLWTFGFSMVSIRRCLLSWTPQSGVFRAGVPLKTASKKAVPSKPTFGCDNYGATPNFRSAQDTCTETRTQRHTPRDAQRHTHTQTHTHTDA